MHFPFRPLKIFDIVFALLILPLALVLVPVWSWENGPIEGLQALVLFLGAQYIWLLHHDEPRLTAVHRTYAAFLVLLGLRELSFGRIFFPTALRENGPQFIAMHDVPGWQLLYAILGVYMIYLLYSFWKYMPWRRLLHLPVPIVFLGGIVLGAVLSTAGDHTWVLDYSHAETMEELGELLMYLCFVHTGLWYHHYLAQVQEDD